MQYRQLGQTSLQVSAIGLGTMTWGEQNTPEEGFAQMDLAWEQGVNFMDVAEMYPIPPRAETQGATERIIGQWMAARKNRADVILATKVSGPAPGMPWIRGGQARFNAEQIQVALDESLKRLQTDYIDLYQLHWPERDTNYFGALGYTHHPQEAPFTPLAETLAVLAECVRVGKIRYVGLSNETPWGLFSALTAAQQHGLPRVVSIQNPYNLLNRSFEVGLAEMAIREQVGLLAYSPLAFGVLSGKYLDGRAGEKARLNRFPGYDRYSNPRAELATRRYVQLAQTHMMSPTQLALAYVNAQPFVTSNIIGATDLSQMRENIESIHIQLSPEVIQGIEQIHQEYPNPCP